VKGVIVSALQLESLDKASLVITLSGSAIEKLGEQGVTLDALRDTIRASIERLAEAK
jgi:hypothetical protein